MRAGVWTEKLCEMEWGEEECFPGEICLSIVGVKYVEMCMFREEREGRTDVMWEVRK